MAASHEDLVRTFDRREPWQKAPYVPHRWRGSGCPAVNSVVETSP